jgi:N6-adenosine-specific RNA methylase IME4
LAITITKKAAHCPWPSTKFSTIYADPPWKFKTYSDVNQTRAAANHYSVMPDNDINKLPVADLAEKDAVLLLWVLNPMLPHGLATMAAWGFTFKTVAFTWGKYTKTGDKWHFGMGYWTRQNTESCLLGTRGKPKAMSHSVRQFMPSPVREHSRKPDETYGRIEELVKGPYVELFARNTRPGWTSWGNEVGKF